MNKITQTPQTLFLVTSKQTCSYYHRQTVRQQNGDKRHTTLQLLNEVSSSRSCFVFQPPVDWKGDESSVCVQLRKKNLKKSKSVATCEPSGRRLWFVSCSLKVFVLKKNKNEQKRKETHWQKFILTERLKFSINIGFVWIRCAVQFGSLGLPFSQQYKASKLVSC